jgi:plasmid stability protein
MVPIRNRHLEAMDMATLTIKNLPQPLLDRLRARAGRHRRSLNREVITCLESVVQGAPLDPDALLVRARALRRTPAGLRLTDRALERLKDEGRP